VERTREHEALAEAGRLLTSTLDVNEVLLRLVHIARSRLDVDVVRIWLLDETGERLRLRAESGNRHAGPAGHDRLSREHSLVGWVFTHRQPLVLPDVLADPRVVNREWFASEGLVNLLCVPIVLDDSVVGILACMRREPRDFTPAEVALAEALAPPAAVAVRNASLYAEALERLDEIQAFRRVVADTLSSPDLETALRTIVRELRGLLHSDAAVCSLLDPATGDLDVLTGSGTRLTTPQRYRVRPGEGLVGVAFAERRPMRSDDYLRDPKVHRTRTIEAWAQSEGVISLIVVPVIDAAEQTIGFLWAFNRRPVPFTARHEAMAVGLARQATLAIGRVRAFEEERRRARQTTALLDIARFCASPLDSGRLLRQVAQRTASAVGAERCAIYLWRDGHLTPAMGQFADGHPDADMWERFRALRAEPMELVPAHAEAVRSRRPIAATRDSGLLPRWCESFGIAASLVLPLVAQDEVVGTMSLDDARPHATWEPAQVDLAMTIAAQVALALKTERHYADARQRAQEVEALAAAAETLTSTLDLQSVLEAIADSTGSLIGAHRAVVFELDPAARCLGARAVRGIGIEPGFTLKVGQGAVGQAALRRQPVWSADVLRDPPPGYEEPYEPSGQTLGAHLLQYGFRAILAAPVISRDAVLGAVAVYWNEPHRPDEREVRLLSALARHAAVAMENARLVGDLRRTLADLRAAQETLVRGATLRAVGELAAGAAHHLNNLMAVVLGRTQLLLLKAQDPATVQSLRSIERAALEAADTVRRIQGFSRTSGGREAARFDVNAVVREAMEFTRSRWQDEAQLRGAPIEVDLDLGVVPEVSGRVAEIREVVTSLILNAVDALPMGGRIVISTRSEPGRVRVAVSDTGAGMPDEVKRRAFEPFFTTKGVKRTGLGLAVAYGTIERHHGEIALESEEGKGSTVTFSLPAAESRGGEGLEPPPPPPRRIGSILVIDDDDDVRQLVSDALTAQGHTVTTASGGREGLMHLQTVRYDLVITDLGMPDLNGWEVARAVKVSRPDTPVLLLTGWADVVDPSAGRGVEGIIKKPFDVKILATAVSDALAIRG
jgi:GAF domain-containing protein/anti-sigma regulatory factor (Ser/Thr protein kinase)